MILSDAYNILNIEKTANLDKVKEAYRDLALIWHPDRIPLKNERLRQKATDNMREINVAYELIKDHLSNKVSSSNLSDKKSDLSKIRNFCVDVEHQEMSEALDLISIRKNHIGIVPRDVMVPRYYHNTKFTSDNNLTVSDLNNGLMWEKGFSKEEYSEFDVWKYLNELNRNKFAGYSTWRLPNLSELLTLLTKEKNSNDIYIDPCFLMPSCSIFWSSDKCHNRWYIDFKIGELNFDRDGRRAYSHSCYVRAVRTINIEIKQKYSLRDFPIIIESGTGDKGRLLYACSISHNDLRFLNNEFAFCKISPSREGFVDFSTGLIWYLLGNDIKASSKYGYGLEKEDVDWVLDEFMKKRVRRNQNWRLPTVSEILSLVRKDFVLPWLYNERFENLFFTSDSVNTKNQYDKINRRVCVSLNPTGLRRKADVFVGTADFETKAKVLVVRKKEIGNLSSWHSPL